MIRPEKVLQETRSHLLSVRAASHASSSAIVPGLGQLLQGRLVAAIVQFGTVVGYGVVTLASSSSRALWIALAWNVYSAIDAYRHDRD